MMGIPCEYPSFIYGDNKSVLINASNPFSMLKKKSSLIAYHFVRENVSKDECRVIYINTHNNVADMLTNPLCNGEKRVKISEDDIASYYMMKGEITVYWHQNF